MSVLIVGPRLLAALALGCAGAWAQGPSKSVPVTVDNFIRAETHHYLENALKDAGGLGKFGHHRDLLPVERHVVVRPNRDTFYSPAVIDFNAGPVTITLPDGSRREFAQPPTMGDIAASIGPGLAKAALAGRVGAGASAKVVDLSHRIERIGNNDQNRIR